jgi:hypothetical protein
MTCSNSLYIITLFSVKFWIAITVLTVIAMFLHVIAKVLVRKREPLPIWTTHIVQLSGKIPWNPRLEEEGGDEEQLIKEESGENLDDGTCLQLVSYSGPVTILLYRSEIPSKTPQFFSCRHRHDH